MNPDQPYQTAPQPAPPALTSSNSSPANLRQPIPLIGKVLGILILAVFLFMIYMTVVKNPAETASNNFMGYITEGKVDEAIKLTNATSDSDRSFFNSAATAVKGSSKLIDSGKQDKKHYFLYELSSDTSKYARTILEEQSSKWVVISFVHNKEKLKLFPDTSTTKSSSPLFRLESL